MHACMYSGTTAVLSMRLPRDSTKCSWQLANAGTTAIWGFLEQIAVAGIESFIDINWPRALFFAYVSMHTAAPACLLSNHWHHQDCTRFDVPAHRRAAKMSLTWGHPKHLRPHTLPDRGPTSKCVNSRCERHQPNSRPFQVTQPCWSRIGECFNECLTLVSECSLFLYY